MANEYDLIILGAGPAGLTAGIYGARSGLKTLIIENALPGGVAATTHRIDNYPGFPEGIRGSDLTDKMVEQTKKFGVEIKIEQPENFKKEGDLYVVETNTNSYTGKVMIVATGTQAKRLEVKGEAKFWGRGVSYCAVCDGPFYKGMDVAIIGCGNSGIQEGLYMLKFSPKVKFVEFLPYITADKILEDEARSHENMEFYLNSELVAINGEETVSSITVKHRETGEETDIPVQGVFIYIGLIPNTDFLKNKLDLDGKGYIRTYHLLETSMKGVFAAGDVRTKILRQVSTAVGDGALAAYLAEEYIRKTFK